MTEPVVVRLITWISFPGSKPIFFKSSTQSIGRISTIETIPPDITCDRRIMSSDSTKFDLVGLSFDFPPESPQKNLNPCHNVDFSGLLSKSSSPLILDPLIH